MSGAAKMLQGLVASLVGLVRQAKKDYDAEGRFNKIRIQILAAFGVNVLAAVVLALSVGPREVELAAFVQPAFPSNLLVIQNELGRSLFDVEVTIDGRWRAILDELKPGKNGFTIDQIFLDKEHLSPPRDQKLRRLVLVADEDRFELSIQAPAAPVP